MYCDSRVKTGTRASFQTKFNAQITIAVTKSGTEMRETLIPAARIAVISGVRDSMPIENSVEKSTAKPKTRDIKTGSLYRKYLIADHTGAPAFRMPSMRSKKSTMRYSAVVHRRLRATTFKKPTMM